jgi:hypothetical protein
VRDLKQGNFSAAEGGFRISESLVPHTFRRICKKSLRDTIECGASVFGETKAPFLL